MMFVVVGAGSAGSATAEKMHRALGEEGFAPSKLCSGMVMGLMAQWKQDGVTRQEEVIEVTKNEEIKKSSELEEVYASSLF